jgi:hypothetical protein
LSKSGYIGLKAFQIKENNLTFSSGITGQALLNSDNPINPDSDNKRLDILWTLALMR